LQNSVLIYVRYFSAEAIKHNDFKHLQLKTHPFQQIM